MAQQEPREVQQRQVSGQHPLADPGSAGMLDEMTSRGPLQPQLSCESVRNGMQTVLEVPYSVMTGK